MSIPVSIRLAGAALGAAIYASAAVAYIHLPPMNLQRMCTQSNQIRLLKVEKVDREHGVIVFELVESFKGAGSAIDSFRHSVRVDSPDSRRILDWAGAGKKAVMFSSETEPGGPAQGLGYVFIDEFCYTVSFNGALRRWLMLRGEPAMSGCYSGPVEALPGLVKDVLDGKQVDVPTKGVRDKDASDKRTVEINQMLQKNRYRVDTAAGTELSLPAARSEYSWRAAAWMFFGISMTFGLAGSAIVWIGWRALRRARR